MSHDQNIDRSILVFSIWGVFGFLGLGFLLEGFSRGAYLVSLIGTILILATFVGHVVVNVVFEEGFSSGETALGIGASGLLSLVFVIGWAEGGMLPANFYAGLTFFGALTVALITYLVTRYGLRGAFSHFHLRQPASITESER